VHCLPVRMPRQSYSRRSNGASRNAILHRSPHSRPANLLITSFAD
jgi:hypothetical protein